MGYEMNFGKVFKDALVYPFMNINKFLIMLALNFGSFLIIPIFMASGYEFRIIESTIQGSNELPDFSKSGDLISQGFKIIAASIIYGIPSYIVMFALIISRNPDLSVNGVYSTIILAFIGFLVNIVFILSIVNMVAENRFGAVFDFKIVFQLIKNLGWGRYLSYLVVYSIIIEILGLIISMIFTHFMNMGSTFLIAFLVIMLHNAYVLMFGGRFSGLIYSNAAEGLEMEGR